jgi:hypothetical protein
LKFALALGYDEILTLVSPILARFFNKSCSFVRTVNAIAFTGAFHASGRVDRVTKQLKAGLVATQDASRHGSAVQANAHRQVGGIRA